MLLRSGIILLLASCAQIIYAQRETTLLKAVEVYGLPEEKYLAGSSITNIDSSLQKNYSSNHLGEALTFQFPMYFRNYGNGMLSGISMRGTSPQHTAVLWNGININSFSLGQSDFSILPMVAFDKVSVHEGGGSSRFGSGAFGGSVLLNSTTAHDRPLISLQQEAGSFERYFSSLKFSLEEGSLSSSTSAYRLQSKNDFLIRSLNERQQHASFLQQGLVQNFKYTISSNKALTLNYWFHDADREIQPTIGKYNSTDEQQDRNHRLILAYQQNGTFGASKISGGVVDDVIIFNGSRSEVLRWVSSANHQFTFAKAWHTQFSADWNHIIGKIKEYGGNIKEERIDLAASLQRDYQKHSFSLNLRQPFISHVSAPFLPYLGASILLFEKNEWQIKLNVNASKNFRAPTLNDRYWQNAGREDIKPETSHAGEAGLSWDGKILSIRTKGFYQLVDQWIQWVPDSNGIYRPQNIKQVSAAGSETSVASHWKIGDVKLHTNLSYQFVKSTTRKAVDFESASVGKQLIYTPIHTGSTYTSATYKQWSLNLFAQYSSKRFTEMSNAPLYTLDAFALVDVMLARLFEWKRSEFALQASVKNIFNADYQLYSGRAMPGRNFNIQLSYQLKNKQHD